MTTAIYKSLCACLNLSPSSEEACTLIRRAYQEPEPSPRLPRTADAVYWSVFPDSVPEPARVLTAENPSASSHLPSVSLFSAWILQIVCYGPSALEHARRIRTFLFLDGAGMPRAILRKAGIYPLPDPPEPILLPEEESGRWRQRADLTISFRLKETLNYPARRNAVTVPPAVTLYSCR